MFSNQKPKSIALAILLSVSSITAFGANQACVLEGVYGTVKNPAPFKECFQNTGFTQEALESFCKITQNAAGFSAHAGVATKVTFMPACPEKPVATCSGRHPKEIVSFYNTPQPYSGLPSSLEVCSSQGGKWKQ